MTKLNVTTTVTEKCRLLSTYSTLCSKEIYVPTKIPVLPSGTLSQTPDFKNFATAYRSSKRAIN